MTATRGVYFLANDGILDLAIAFLNSFRKHNPTIPLCLIPFDREFARLAALGGDYGFTVFDNAWALDQCDHLGQAFHGNTAGQYRKLAAWEGGFDEFLYIDTDTVVLSNIDFAFDYLAETDFLTSHSHIPQIRKWVWRDSIYSTGALTANQIEFAANTGFIVSRASVLSIKEATDRLPAAVALAPHMELNCTEQPFLNYLIVTSGKRYTSLFTIVRETGRKDIPLELWAGRRLGVSFAGRIFHLDASRVLLVHWAGQWQPSPHEVRLFDYLNRLGVLARCPVTRLRMPYRRLWNHYRRLRQSRVEPSALNNSPA